MLIAYDCEYMSSADVMIVFFFFQAEDGIRDLTVTGVQTCALPIYRLRERLRRGRGPAAAGRGDGEGAAGGDHDDDRGDCDQAGCRQGAEELHEIGRASCRERG